MMKACWHLTWKVHFQFVNFLRRAWFLQNGSSCKNEIFGWSEEKIHGESKKWSVRDKELYCWLFEKLHHSWIQVHFWKRTLVHQVKFSISNDLKSWFFFSRTFWIIALIASIGMCGYLLHTSYAKWQYKPDIGLTRKTRPVQEIPYPTVTICPITKVSRTLTNFELTYRRYFEDDEVHGESYVNSEYFEYLLHVCDPQLLNNFKFNYSLLPEEDTLMAQLEEILYTLDDSMMFCKWRESYVDCDEIFTAVLTDQGNCFSFNNLLPEEIFNEDM